MGAGRSSGRSATVVAVAAPSVAAARVYRPVVWVAAARAYRPVDSSALPAAEHMPVVVAEPVYRPAGWRPHPGRAVVVAAHRQVVAVVAAHTSAACRPERQEPRLPLAPPALPARRARMALVDWSRPNREPAQRRRPYRRAACRQGACTRAARSLALARRVERLP